MLIAITPIRSNIFASLETKFDHRPQLSFGSRHRITARAAAEAQGDAFPVVPKILISRR
jgi:hypothetical protein